VPTIKLTQAAATRLKPPTNCVNITHWDSQLPGFGLRISSKNRRTWICMYRVGGKAVMETLGTMAVTPKVDDARNLARASMTKARAGIHPVAQRREQEAAAEQAAKAQQKTFAWLIEHTEQGKHGEVTKGFLAEYASRNQRLSTQYETRRTLNRALPYLGYKLLTEITRSDITELLDDVAAKRRRQRKDLQGGPNGEARAIHATLNTVFNWAVAEQHIAVSPMATLSKSRHGKPQDRERTLSVEEIKAFWAACDQIGWPFQQIGQLLLLTGQRAAEVSGMRWSELREAGRWTLPGDRVKNGRAHTVFLSSQARAIIDGLPRLDDEYVFTTTGRGAVTGFSVAKAKVDGLMQARLGDRTLPHWTWHDLRRTTATGMAENGTAPHIVESVLNHISGHKAGIRGVYNRAAYGPAREAAMNSWGQHIDRVIGRGGDNVVVLRPVDLHKTAID